MSNDEGITKSECRKMRIVPLPFEHWGLFRHSSFACFAVAWASHSWRTGRSAVGTRLWASQPSHGYADVSARQHWSIGLPTLTHAPTVARSCRAFDSFAPAHSACACPSVSLASPPLRSVKRHVFNANGALLRSAWGNAPGIMGQEDLSAERAFHEGHESRLQRSPVISIQFPGAIASGWD
jgi:hypothetical protein